VGKLNLKNKKSTAAAAAADQRGSKKTGNKGISPQVKNGNQSYR
jgi:hypothetical protein